MSANSSEGGARRDIDLISAEAADALGTGRQIALFSKRYAGFGLENAYQVTAEVRRLREARGEKPIGRKIGFTNRTIWAEYGVYAPIWGYVYDSTVRDFSEAGADFSLAGLCEPRIEPEIIFGLATSPAAGMDERDLLGCVEWVAHGFEIVQSLFPNWQFAAPDTIAAYGLHGALWIGPRHAVAPRAEDWGRELTAFEIDLYRNGILADHGRAANVLDGPAFALRHLVAQLASDPGSPPLAAGEIVTTGTLTRALPVEAGETWTTKLSGAPLEDARLRFV